MCIIVHSKEGTLPDRNRLETAWVNNPHGFGLMYVDDGRVVAQHTLPKTFEDVWSHLKWVEGIPWALHFRWVTRGKKAIDQCHPFQVTSMEELGKDLFMMHNGTLSFLDDVVALTRGEKSDTKMLAEILGKTAHRLQDPDLLFGVAAQQYLQKEIGAWNKLLFLDSDGKFRYMNRYAGKDDGDFWYSNTYSFQKNYRLESLFEAQTIPKSTFRPAPQRLPAVEIPITVRGADKPRKAPHPMKSDIFNKNKIKRARTHGTIVPHVSVAASRVSRVPSGVPLPSSPNAYLFSKQWGRREDVSKLAGFSICDDSEDDILFAEYMNDKP